METTVVETLYCCININNLIINIYVWLSLKEKCRIKLLKNSILVKEKLPHYEVYFFIYLIQEEKLTRHTKYPFVIIMI